MKLISTCVSNKFVYAKCCFQSIQSISNHYRKTLTPTFTFSLRKSKHGYVLDTFVILSNLTDGSLNVSCFVHSHRYQIWSFRNFTSRNMPFMLWIFISIHTKWFVKCLKKKMKIHKWKHAFSITCICTLLLV